MSYADRYYYGLGKINVVASDSDNGKTISAYNEDSSKYYTTTVADGKASFKVAGTNYYTIAMDNTVMATVPIGYGKVQTVDIYPAVEYSLTVYSAAEDTVYYYEDNDTSTTPITLCTTGSDGIAERVSLTAKPGTSITFYSSVAKDTTSGTAPYSKTAILSEDTEAVMVMPEGTLYWYGYFSPTTDTAISGTSGTVTKNTNTVTSTGKAGIMGTLDVTDYTTLYAEAYVGCGYGRLGVKTDLTTDTGTKLTSGSVWAINSFSLESYSGTQSLAVHCYIVNYELQYRRMWCE